MRDYAIYLRKSRADIEAEANGEMETLARHEKYLIELSRTLLIPIKNKYIYKEVVSGSSLDERIEMRKLLKEIEAGNIEGVFVMEVDRLTRGDNIDQGKIFRIFKNAQVKIITPIKTYDPNNEYDEDYLEFGLFMSHREYMTINRRIQRGRIASVNEGKTIVSTPPYGYDKIKITNDIGFTLTPNEHEAPVVKQIFYLYNAGNGMTIISNKLDEMGIKPRNRDIWSKSTISDILKNPVYTGKIRWSYRKEKKVFDGDKVHKLRKINDEYIMTEGLHPALISQEEFDKAQDIRKQNVRPAVKQDKSLKNPFTGLFYCKLCGSLMTRLGENKKNKYDTLKCSNKYCNNISSPIFLIENKLLEDMRVLVDDYSNHITTTIKSCNFQDLIKEYNTKFSELNCTKKILDKELTNIYERFESDEISRREFIIKRDEKTDLIKDVNNEIARYISKKEDIIRLNNLGKTYFTRAYELIDSYKDLKTATEKNNILKELLDKVYYIKTQPNYKGSLLNVNFILEIQMKFPY